MKHVLCLSGSRHGDEGYLMWAKHIIPAFLKKAGAPEKATIAFVPFANPGMDGLDAYAKRTKEAFEKLGYTVVSVHEKDDAKEALYAADAIFVGGGNTFELVNELHRRKLFSVIQDLAKQGIPYMGSSAGSAISGKGIHTVNDMSIVAPPSLEGLGLVPVYFNCHYPVKDVTVTPFQESRKKRLTEFLRRHPGSKVLGLQEGCGLEIHGKQASLVGRERGVWFDSDSEHFMLKQGQDMTDLLQNA